MCASSSPVMPTTHGWSSRSLRGQRGEGGRLRLKTRSRSRTTAAGATSPRISLAILDCRRYVISTSGARHGHPNETAMARILKYGGTDKEIMFNYRCRAEQWNVVSWRRKVRLPGRSAG